MYCQDCGQKVSGRFCSHCGARMGTAALTESNIDELEVLPSWDDEVRYDVLLRHPGVRALIDREAKTAAVGMTGEQFLALADKLMPQPVSIEGLGTVAQILFTRLGIKTEQLQESRVAAPVGEVIVRTLCSLARRGQKIRNVTQAADGCLIEADQTSDLFALKGTLLVSIRRQGNETQVSANATISGQWYDWGKNCRCLGNLFGDLANKAA